MRFLIVHRDKKCGEKNLVKKFPEVNFKFIWKNKLQKTHLKNVDIIISIGGDGTFLSASHFLKNQPILGVNSDHTRSEGALTSIKIDKLGKKLEQIISGKYKIKEYTREKINICRQNICQISTEQALNEVYFGNINPHHTSNYYIEYNNKKEKQKSSGVLISTGTGSTAWYKTTGGIRFSRTKKQLRFRIRELFSRKLHKPKIKKGKIKLNKSLKIFPEMNHGIIAIDSNRLCHLKRGDSVEVSIGDPLKVIQ